MIFSTLEIFNGVLLGRFLQNKKCVGNVHVLRQECSKGIYHFLHLSTIIVTIKKTVTIIVDNCTLIVKMVDSCTIVIVVVLIIPLSKNSDLIHERCLHFCFAKIDQATRHWKSRSGKNHKLIDLEEDCCLILFAFCSLKGEFIFDH